MKIDKICDSIDSVCQFAGHARHVAIGGKPDRVFGMEQTPMNLDIVADVARLAPRLAQRGYSADGTDSILHGNFFRFLREHLR